MDRFKEEIIKAIKKEVKADIALEIPPKPELGDYAFPCFSLSKTTQNSQISCPKIVRIVNVFIKF